MRHMIPRKFVGTRKVVNITEPAIWKSSTFLPNEAVDTAKQSLASGWLDVLARDPVNGCPGDWVILDRAGLLDHTTEQPEIVSTEFAFKRGGYSLRYSIRLTPNIRAALAWERLSGERDWNGDTDNFARELVNYAKMYLSAGVFTEEIPASVLMPRTEFLSVVDVLRRAGNDGYGEWDAFSEYCHDNGVGYMIEAYESGVPMEDIIA